tara:strand:- start:116 stop:259 length:144 start_codon:yes stop_codon:yes gene_type:complete
VPSVWGGFFGFVKQFGQHSLMTTDILNHLPMAFQKTVLSQEVEELIA